jgi:excisionase family DNA binding protein
MTASVDDLLTTRQLATHLNIHERTTRTWRKRGLPAIHILGSIRFDLADVQAWIFAQQQEVSRGV